MTIEAMIARDDEGWFKSFYSGGDPSTCVEFRYVDGGVQLRNDKAPGGPVLEYTNAEWDAFLLGVYQHQFDVRW